MSYLPIETEKIRHSQKNIDKAIDAITKQGISFNAVVIRGMSGALMATYVAEKYGVRIIIVRKEDETTHGEPIEGGWEYGSPYIILDDFVSTGETIGIIKSTMDKGCPNAECVGVLLYSNHPNQTDPNEVCALEWADSNMHKISTFAYMGEIELEMLYAGDEEDSPWFDLRGMPTVT